MLVFRPAPAWKMTNFVVPEEHVLQYEISGRVLLRKIRRLVGWQDNYPRVCKGEYLPAHQAIRFNLMETQVVDMFPVET